MLSVKVKLMAARFEREHNFIKLLPWKKFQILKAQKPHRSGWQSKLNKKSPEKMSVPTLLSTNVRSILNKVDDIQLLLNTRLYSNNCIFLVQETWLNLNICSEILTPTNYSCCRQDRQNSSKTTGGGVLIFINQSWCRNAKTYFQYSKNNIECLSVTCRPKFLTGFRGVSITNVYIPPSTGPAALSDFYNEFLPSVASNLSDHLCLVAGDFNRSNTYPICSLGLTDTVNFNTREDAQLDHIYTNCPEFFETRKQAPLGLSDHCIIRLLPKIYSRDSIRYSQVRDKERLEGVTYHLKTNKISDLC
jgi:hypothetical protein